MTVVEATRLAELDAITGWRVMAPDRPFHRMRDVRASGLSDWARCYPMAVLLGLSPRVSRHSAPRADCTCGYRVMRTRRGVLAYFAERGFASDALVLAKVRGWGRVSGPAVDDPPGTVRVQRFRVLQVYVPGSLPASVATSLRRDYRVPVVISPLVGALSSRRGAAAEGRRLDEPDSDAGPRMKT
ncbi:hypothetical protein [uncultured Jatrophihabitans sp.]|uniref:hypothetical protein n=1 Tax=uncultured Jatrophihabitans sp. TaxID=1610747 RepID=UPI0035CBE6CD